MVQFRKVILLLAVLALTAGLASAQINPLVCVANAGVPPIVRSEGVAEEVGQVIINCTGGSSTASGVELQTINVQIFMNANITSRLLSTAGAGSEALLLIDEPVGAEQVEAAQVPNLTKYMASGDGTYKTLGAAGRPTVFGAQQASPNSVVWLNVPFDPPGTAGKNRVIRLVNVRANAAQLGIGGGLIPNTMKMFISISGTGSLSLQNPQLDVAIVQRGMVFGASTATYNQCDPLTAKSYPISFTERFGTAFRHQRSPGNQNILGSIYNTESMFYNSAFATVGAGAGLATQGTRLKATFSNVPASVTLSVPCTITNTSGDSATLVAAGTNGSTAGTCSSSASTVALTAAGTGFTGAAVWEVTASNPGAISKLDANVTVSYASNPLPGLGTASVAGNYAPTAVTVVASTEAVPRFVDNADSFATFSINSCRTNLLFPYVTNLERFDTGIAISNTSSDPWSTVKQAGECYINYYGAGAPAKNPAVSTVIAAGAQLVFTLSGGNALQGIESASGFQGYIIATCYFQYAHGYAFVSTQKDGGMAQGYLALVMDKDMFNPTHGGTRTGATSEKLDN